MARGPVLALGVSLVASFAVASPGKASTLYADDFNANSYQLNGVPIGWSVAEGSVDIIGNCPPGFSDPSPGGGCVIDLDGSSADAGVLSNSTNLAGGLQYVLNFYLQNPNATGEVVDVNFGTATLQLTLPATNPWTLYSLPFTPAVTGSVGFSFANQGGDNNGAYLDNVSITNDLPPPAAVPAPLPLLGVAAAWRASRRLRRRRS